MPVLYAYPLCAGCDIIILEYIRLRDYCLCFLTQFCRFSYVSLTQLGYTCYLH